ncbi:hypothetical protein [Protaetiibacter intestinalis]|uniref:Uncharacterized protein n=1 Tax=Protaetiibacter intestinalis TaxID=2419774 RepID=A0A387B975_9MICO|nr:hypothetical protein [Protaetiibacter intestinalis]AYF97499.1 hypothetical protein D7I47_03990 [Protaetiibacter intestinalis]
MNHDGDEARLPPAPRTAPTPLFLGFLGALVVVGGVAFRAGFTVSALADFLLLAAIVTGLVLVVFAWLMIWATRAAQRAERLAAARPGAVVIRAVGSRGLRRAVAALRTEVAFLPLGFTVVADRTGIEVWGGSAEHPLRIGRAPWDAVADIAIVRVSRAGRAADGLSVAILDGVEGSRVELPIAVVGYGLGGLFAPRRPQLLELHRELTVRRSAALELA